LDTLDALSPAATEGVKKSEQLIRRLTDQAANEGKV
jgi:hypothetical protein